MMINENEKSENKKGGKQQEERSAKGEQAKNFQSKKDQNFVDIKAAHYWQAKQNRQQYEAPRPKLTNELI